MSNTAAWAKQVMALPTDAARCVVEFAYHPARYIHPERVSQHVPDALIKAGLNSRNMSIGLLQMAGLSTWTGLDWSNVQHRLALLPLEGLQTVAWRLGLASVAPRLRRVIVGHEWRALSESLSADDWQWVDAWPRPMMATGGTSASASTLNRQGIGQPLNWLPMDALDVLSVSDWATHIQHWGWQVMDAACDAMPAEIGARLRLKLPVINGLSNDPAQLASKVKTPHPTLALTALVAAYPSAVAQWNPSWDAMWLPEATSRQ